MGAPPGEEKMPDWHPTWKVILLSNFAWTAWNMQDYSKFKMYDCFYFTENHTFTLNSEIKILKSPFYLIEGFLHIKKSQKK